MTKSVDTTPLTKAEKELVRKLDNQRVRAENRFPMITALVATFGFVSVLYGFEKLIDSSEFLSDNPIILLVLGLAILVVTGTVYKKLN